RMQVGALAAVIELVVIATAVVAVAGMQGLVRVAYEMDNELQRLQALGIAAAAVGEDACLHFKRLVDAAAVGAVGLALVAAASLADIDVVPRRAALAQAWIGTAQVVGPGGDPGERGFGLALQQARGFGARGGAQLLLGHARDQAVAKRAPGLCRQDDGKQNENTRQPREAAPGAVGRYGGGAGPHATTLTDCPAPPPFPRQ